MVYAQGDPLAWLNSVRRAARVPEVSADARLSETALGWAERLAASGILTHRGDDGSTGLDRYRAQGGTEVQVGEILGAGPGAPPIEKGWMESPEHRALALSPAWTDAGWGSARSGSSLVMVLMFTRKLVEDLSITEGAAGLSVSGRFVPSSARGCRIFNGLDEVQPVEWDATRRQFRFLLPVSALEGYVRLGYTTAGGVFTLTNAFNLPR